MGNNLGVRWELATPFGVSVNPDTDAWHAGHVTDVLALDDGLAGLLVASHGGGVWLSTAGGATALSDRWDCPDVRCLALGPDGPRHVYAGTAHGQIYETVADAVAPLLEWRPIERPLPSDAGSVRSILVLPRHRRIVAVCSGGVFWSRTSGSLWAGPQWPGRRRARYVWYRARDVGGCHGGTIAALRDVERPGQDDLEYVTIVVGASAGGIWVGGWSGDDLHFEQTLDLPTAGAASVAASDLRAARVYAATSLTDGTLGGFWTSDDGGLQWALTLAADRDGTQLRFLAGGQGDGWNNCVSVMPDRPNVVLLGWHDTFASADEGRTWIKLDGADHLHADVHALRFAAQGLNPGHALYIGSDGGVAELDAESVVRYATDGAAAGEPVVRSNLNRELPMIELYATSNAGDRQFSGNLAVSLADDFVLAGSQDNGTLLARTDVRGPWSRVVGGDGSASGIWGDDLFNTAVFGQPEVRRHTRDAAGGRFTSIGPVPIGAAGSLSPSMIEPVRRPSYRNDAGDLMVYVAGAMATDTQQAGVYGLFVPPSRASYWQWLGDLPGSPAISALASVTGAMVWVGTSGARMFALDASGATPVVETPMPAAPKATPFDPVPTRSWVMRIATLHEGRAYAIVSAVYATPDPVSSVVRLDGLRWVNTAWTPSIGSHAADSLAYGLEVVAHRRAEPVFVSTDRDVHASVDEGRTWQSVADGLPARVHGADLRFADRSRPPADGDWLYLATFGRSLWRASMANLDIP